MNPNIQKHISSLLLAIAGIGTELLGKTSAEPEPVTGEPTEQKPKGPRRPRKMAEPVTAPVEKVEEKKPDPPVNKIEGEDVPYVGPPVFACYEEARAYIDPITKTAQAGLIKGIVEKYLPAGETGLRNLVDNYPGKLAEFKRDIDALLIG